MTRHSLSEHSLRAGAAAAAAARVTEKADKETPRLRRPTLAVLVVAAAALLPAARAAPAAALAAPAEPVWIYPCGIPNNDAPRDLNMRNVKQAFKHFRDYLEAAVSDVSREWQRASSVYGELRDGDFQIDMEWLPKNQFNHYKDNVQGMKLPEKLVHFLQHVHDGVQKYLATAVWLQEEPAADDLLLNEPLKKRTEFLARIRSQLKNVQCAAQSAIVHSEGKLLVPRKSLLDIVDAEAFPQPSQGTAQLLLRDRAFALRLNAFLKDWLRALKTEVRLFKEKKSRPAKAGAPAGRRRQRHRKKQQRRQQQQQQQQVARA